MDYNDYHGRPWATVFKKRYNAQIDESSRKFVKQVEYYRFDDEQLPTTVNVEYGVEIVMSRDDFEDLNRDITKLEYIDEQSRKIDSEYAAMYDRQMHEQKLRDATPALKTAYDKYKLILDMVSGSNNGKNN
jgi:hypothetical protein